MIKHGGSVVGRTGSVKKKNKNSQNNSFKLPRGAGAPDQIRKASSLTLQRPAGITHSTIATA